MPPSRVLIPLVAMLALLTGLFLRELIEGVGVPTASVVRSTSTPTVAWSEPSGTVAVPTTVPTTMVPPTMPVPGCFDARVVDGMLCVKPTATASYCYSAAAGPGELCRMSNGWRLNTPTPPSYVPGG